MNKEQNESFARFFENPSRESFRDLLQYNSGEEDYLDFKREWPDIPKLAKHILAFSNSGGGVLVVGVEESGNHFNSIGLSEKKDKVEIENGVRGFIGSEADYVILDFAYEASEYQKIIGKVFQVLIVNYNEIYLPLVSKKASGNNIKSNTIYVRRGTSTQEASYEEIQKLLNIRIKTQYSTASELELEEHLAQLKILYSQIDKTVAIHTPGTLGINLEALSKAFSGSSLFGSKVLKDNPNYPKEDYEEFILRMINLKKERIEKEIT
ncbi:hypothetical protein BK121_08820 [Paenibacillus odorifer]|uniref:RNA-binding domain-containing protein n=1 Tax=Paenibacillus odorifer TaxID=189426 RepID=UPI00096DD79C|nr:RNA-binding domain-containing protein [Paenibacillus odorifer]OMC73001.1 hypothetical protein BK121_08820 [Paenibacillus odorifer]